MVRVFFALAIIVIVCGAQAQIALPPVQVPRLPVELPVDVNKTLSTATGALSPESLRNLRKLRVRELLRTHRDAIETDPRGAPMIRAELLAFSPSDEALAKANGAGFSLVRAQTLDGLDARIVVLRAPAGMSTKKALQRLKKVDPQGTYDFNHIFTESGRVGGANSNNSASSHPLGSPAGKIGLIDGGIENTHPVFHGAVIYAYGCGGKPVPNAHGTAVASLLIGRAEPFHGGAPGAELYAADVYCGVPTGGAVDALAAALAWMSREKVPVINISLVGPPNIMLETVIRAVVARGHLIVAAVGNDGPSAPPLYPAAYAGVIGVTGVDVRQKVLLEAVRGSQVDFSAPGADMVAANLSHTYASVRGTSFAAPLVTGLISMQLAKFAAERAVAEVTRQAIDLGAHGPDRVYGHGLVGEALRVAPFVTQVVDK